MVAECINSVMQVAMVSIECVVIEEDDIFCQLRNVCNTYDSLSASNVVARQNRYDE